MFSDCPVLNALREYFGVDSSKEKNPNQPSPSLCGERLERGDFRPKPEEDEPSLKGFVTLGSTV